MRIRVHAGYYVDGAYKPDGGDGGQLYVATLDSGEYVVQVKTCGLNYLEEIAFLTKTWSYLWTLWRRPHYALCL
jgi:hypothetical protein